VRRRGSHANPAQLPAPPALRAALAAIALVMLLVALPSSANAQDVVPTDKQGQQEPDESGGEESGGDESGGGKEGCKWNEGGDNESWRDRAGSDGYVGDLNGCEEGDGIDQDDDGSPTDEDSGPGADEFDGGSCEIATFDVCGPAITIVKGILDKAWTWTVGITESVAEWVMGTAFTLPSMDGELLDKYDSMVDTVKPAIIVGVLLLALGMMLSPPNVTAQHAILSGLPKIALVGLALAFFPEFVGMMTDITGSLGSAFGNESEVGGALSQILNAAGTFGIAAGVFTANPGIGVVVAGLTVLPLLVLFLIIFAVGILIDFLFAVLVMLGPICLICWPIPGLQTITVVWFRSIMACFLIPVLFSIEAAVGSWIVASPELLTNADGAAGDFQVILGTICLILLMLVMYATPKKVLDWAFGAALGGSFSFKGAKNAVQSFSQELVKGAASTAAPASGLATAMGGAGGGKSRGLSAALAGAAGGAAGAKIGGAAKNVSLAGAVGSGPGGAGGLFGPGKRGLRENPGDPLKTAKDAMGADKAAEKNGQKKPEQQKANAAQAGKGTGFADAPKTGTKEADQGAGQGAGQGTDQKSQARGAAADSAGFQKDAAKEQAPGRFEEARQAHDALAGSALSATGSSISDPNAEDAMPTDAGVEEAGLAAASATAAGSVAGSVSGEGGVPEAHPSSGGWQEHLAANGFGNDVGDAIGRDAQASGQLAGQSAYERASAALSETGAVQASQLGANVQSLRQQAADLPGVSNPQRGEMRGQADSIESQAAQIRADLPQEAHAAGMRAAASAAPEAAGQYAGEAAHIGAAQRAEAVRPIAAAEATEMGAQARNDTQAAQTAYDDAQGRHQLTADAPNADTGELRDLGRTLEEASTRAAAWAPGGAAYNGHIESRAASAYQQEYDALYQRATGNEPSRGSRSPGYAPRGQGGPPTFGGGPKAPSPGPAQMGSSHVDRDCYGGYGGARPTWRPVDEKR
jgi:hypothetical protein